MNQWGYHLLPLLLVCLFLTRELRIGELVCFSQGHLDNSSKRSCIMACESRLLSSALCWAASLVLDEMYGPRFFFILLLPPEWEILSDDSFASRVLVLTSQNCHLPRSPPNPKGVKFSLFRHSQEQGKYLWFLSPGLTGAVGCCGPSTSTGCFIEPWVSAHLPCQSGAGCENPFSGVESFKVAQNFSFLIGWLPSVGETIV